MGTFTNDIQNGLYEKGIEVDDSGVSIKLTLKGMAWILNYINISGGIGVSLKLLLEEISKHRKDEEQWRDLRCKVVPIEVYDKKFYYQYIFYLNGSPPKVFYSCFPGELAIRNSFMLPVDRSLPFKVEDDFVVDIEFSEQEVAELKQGNLIIESG